MARPRGDIKARVLAAARRRFLVEGVDGASLRKIAKEAGTSIGMIYYYFPTKDDLFSEVVEEVYAQLLADLSQALQGVDGTERRLLRLYARLGQLSDEEVVTVQLVLREAMISAERLDRLAERFKRGHLPLVLGTLLQGVAEGAIERSLHPAVLLTSTLALGAVPQLMLKQLGKRLPIANVPSSEVFAESLFAVLWRGIGRREQKPVSKRTRSKKSRRGEL
jgi:AcrR family transcriptional regulator